MGIQDIRVRRFGLKIYDRLGKRATKHGISTEIEIRQILSLVVSAPEKIVFLKLDLDGLNQRTPHDPIKF